MLVIWIAVAQHLLWAFLLLSFGPLNTTGLRWIIELSGGPRRAGIALLAVALLALVPHWRFAHRRDLLTFALYAPQQVLVTWGSFHAAYQVAIQQYADNAPYPWDFILADQSLQILLAIFHSFALLQLYGIIRHRGVA